MIRPEQSAPVILMSGGMDSLFAWWSLRDQQDLLNAIWLYSNINAKYGEKEQSAVKNLATLRENLNLSHRWDKRAQRMVVMPSTDMSPFEDAASGIIPFRNAQLVLNAAQYGQNILLGILEDEINSDKSPEFCSVMETLLNISHRPQYWTEGKYFKVGSPIRHLNKTEALYEYLVTGGPLDMLSQTISCYSGEQGHCGECPSCFKRWVALVNNDMANHTEFLSDPMEYGRKTSALYKAQTGGYPNKRAQEILTAYKKTGGANELGAL